MSVSKVSLREGNVVQRVIGSAHIHTQALLAPKSHDYSDILNVIKH